ncbi:unnamed protein product [Leptidea sinapis]|uniref:Uncharacterized protein n=1 Tax=Leptidea sinapis TaxID=189913 RepID=A0A5E4QS42_9NEOP|nr:unnamed protein product [Leptidea sinapis]
MPFFESRKVEKIARPKALIIRPTDKGRYVDILKRVKQDKSTQQASKFVDKIRKTTTGDMLLILTKDSTDQAHDLQRTIAGVLGDDASHKQGYDLESS